VTVSAELNNDSENEAQDEQVDAAGDEFEEISSDEVDRVVAALETLIASTSSENIKTYLEEAQNSVFYLVYDAEDEEDSEELSDAA
jgi:hypothetical protein